MPDPSSLIPKAIVIPFACSPRNSSAKGHANKSRYSVDDYIVVKMAVEGAEFAILGHLIERGVIDRIKVLFVEWHARLLPDETYETRQDLQRQLRNAGVEVLDWT